MKKTKQIKHIGKKITLSQAKKKAWKQFSLYIRMKDAIEDHTVNVCYTCGEFKDIKKMNAGHGIGGRNNAILFDERIVRPQCIGCNIWGRGQYQIFTRQLIDELGLEVFDQIVTQSRIPVKYKVADLLEIEAKYLEKIKEL